MLELTRTVRLNVCPHAPAAGGTNGLGGRPPMTGLGAHYEFDITCAGPPDPQTGYLVDIGVIDRAVAGAALPLLTQAFRDPEPTPLPRLLRRIAHAAAERIDAPLRRVRWRLSPTLSITLEHDPMRTDAPPTVLIAQRFEFAASHRLHVPALGDERNREIFGKCNNPSGHGHNYRVEACVETPLTQGDNPAFTLADLERAVDETIIRRFDHKHLNADCQEFKDLNPSVENIARVCFDLLRERIDRYAVRLRRVRVWETDKTSATYPA